MRFLVEVRVDFPPELREPDSERRRELLASELRRGIELRGAGAIEAIWRVPGGLHNVGIWNAEDATELHELISSLPLYPWIRTTVTPLAEHPIERETGAR
jgi:muconolactone D-isomerase